MDNYVVKVRMEANGSCVPVSRLDNLDNALGIALNLHQLSNCKHYITVVDDRGNELVRLVRVDAVKFQLPKK